MKKILYNKLAFLLLSVAVAGAACSSDDIENPVENPDIAPARFVPLMVVNGNAPSFTDGTRAEIGTGVLPMTWSEGDIIALYYKPANDSPLNLMEKLTVAQEDAGRQSAYFAESNGDTLLWSQKSTDHVFYALYPYASFTQPDAVNITVPTTQFQSPFKTAVLFASRTYESRQNVVVLNFNQPLTLYKFTIDASETDLEDDAATRISLGGGGGIAGNGQLNMNRGTVTKPTFSPGEDGQTVYPTIELSFESAETLSDELTVWALMYDPEPEQDILLTITGNNFVGEFLLTIDSETDAPVLNRIYPVDVSLSELIKSDRGSIRERDDEEEEDEDKEEDGGEEEEE